MVQEGGKKIRHALHRRKKRRSTSKMRKLEKFAALNHNFISKRRRLAHAQKVGLGVSGYYPSCDELVLFNNYFTEYTIYYPVLEQRLE